ncbi:NDP-sugar synthase [Pseudoruegeria sp. SHC-113]|uniref:NDP-sugar synthase n=1 Tax=Pseudoruegeria sp. SHC-113 TaxID=2855439 RepID=UPI0021BB51FA|nr:NDP-sugar synthase [Pseudoruegeria sp. SHC-113]MCT8159566.1 NDP-sugar synthase [Pseudoruegeria sp. SHC-113]
MFELTDRIGGIAVFAVKSPRLPAPLYPALESLLSGQVALKTPGVVLEFTKAHTPDMAALGALLEIYRRFSPFCQIAVCGLPDPAGFEESSHPITAWLPLFETRKDALESEGLRRLRLADRQAIVLAGERHPGPPSHNVPLGLLPVFGTTLLHGTLQGLSAEGIAEITLDCGPDGEEIRSHALRALVPAQTLRPYNNAYCGREAGSALLALHRDLSAFERECLVVFGHAASTAGIPDLLEAHRTSNCAVSLAIAGSSGSMILADLNAVAASKASFAGVAVFSAGALDGLNLSPGRGFFSTLLPDMMRRGQTVQSFAAAAHKPLVSDSAVYFGHLRASLAERLAGVNGRTLLVEPSARLSRRAQISGPCYIGSDVEIAAGCRISGPAIIETGCRLGRGTEVVSSVLTSLLTPATGGRLHNVVAAPGWQLPILAANDGSRRAVEQAQPSAAPLTSSVARVAAQSSLALARPLQ